MLHEIRVPHLDMPGRPMRLTLWLAKRGQRVHEDRPVAEILVGEVLFELSPPVPGLFTERLVEEDETVVPGQVIGRIEGE